MKTEIISCLTVSTRRREAAEQQTGAGQRDALHGRRSQGTTGRRVEAEESRTLLLHSEPAAVTTGNFREVFHS